MAPTSSYQDLASIGRRDVNYETERWIFNILSLLSISMIVAMTTIRVQQFWRLRVINASRIVTVLFYFTSFCSAIVFNHVYVGVGLAMNGNSCKSSILVCIMFYVVTKLLLYIFMQERIHTIRAAEYTRLKDKPYIIGMVIIMTGSIAIVIYAMYTAQAHVSASSSNSGTCRIGLTPVAAGLLLGWDLTMNIWLTLLFVSLLLPTLRARAQLGNTTSMSAFTRHLVLPSIKAPTPLVSMLSRSPSPTSPPADPEPEVELQIVQSASPIVESLERLIRKSLLGVLLIVIPTTVNLVQFIRMDMLESGFQCFLTCLLDITATTMVFHWLTMTPRETHSGTPMAT